MTDTPMFTDTMAEMTGEQMRAAAKRGAVALLPVGVIECHGPHLPTGTDAFIALQLCRMTRDYAAEAGRECLIAPPFYWGINGVLADFPGSFRIRPETAAALLTDVLESLFVNGFEEVMIISHHGDRIHNEMIRDVLTEMHAKGRTGARWLYTPVRWKIYERIGTTGKEAYWVPWEPVAEMEDFKLTGKLGVHADEFETAAIVRYFPETVAYDKLKGLEPTDLTFDDLLQWRNGGEDARRLTPNGYFGDPNPVDPDLWRHFDETAKVMAKAITTRA